MRIMKFYAFILLCFALCGCGNKYKLHPALQQARNKEAMGESLFVCDAALENASHYLQKRLRSTEEAETWYYRAKIKLEKEKPEEAVIDYKTALSIIKNSRGDTLAARIYTELGDIYRTNGLYQSALKAYKEKFNYDSILNNQHGMLSALNNIHLTQNLIETDIPILVTNKTLDIQKKEDTYAIQKLREKHSRAVEAFYVLILFFTLAIISHKIYISKTEKAIKQTCLNEPSLGSLQLMPIYKRIETLPQKKKDLQTTQCKPLNEKEFITLQETIENLYPKFNELLKTSCSLLNKEDIMFCALSKIHLPSLTIAYCFMAFDTNIVKKRIKQKMTIESKNRKLFDKIFENEKKDTTNKDKRQ